MSREEYLRKRWPDYDPADYYYMWFEPYKFPNGCFDFVYVWATPIHPYSKSGEIYDLLEE